MLPYLGRTDVYLLDQIQKNRFHKGMKILDAGCGRGRNSELFIRSDYEIYGIDKDELAIEKLKSKIGNWNPNYDQDRFFRADLEAIPFKNDDFDYVISSAVLHFSNNRKHFIDLFNELTRVLAPGGVLFIRMTAKHTLESFAEVLEQDIYCIPDGSTRYLLDEQVLKELMQQQDLKFLDPFKTVNVSNLRSMSTIVLQKIDRKRL